MHQAFDLMSFDIKSEGTPCPGAIRTPYVCSWKMFMSTPDFSTVALLTLGLDRSLSWGYPVPVRYLAASWVSTC